jgi:hypothetical protein
MANKLTIDLTDEQVEKIRNHLGEQTNINLGEETFSGWTFTLCCTEFGISWLELEMNTKIDLGEVDWKIE